MATLTEEQAKLRELSREITIGLEPLSTGANFLTKLLAYENAPEYSESVAIKEMYRGRVRGKAVQGANSKHLTIETAGRTVVTVEPILHKWKVPISNEDMRYAGFKVPLGTPFSPTSAFQSKALEAAISAKTMQETTLEMMMVQAITEGKVYGKRAGDDGGAETDYEQTYLWDASWQSKALATEDDFTDANINPLRVFRELAEEIEGHGGDRPRHVILGNEAANAFEANTALHTELNNRGIYGSRQEVIKIPGFDASRIGVYGDFIVYRYNAKFMDVDGNEKLFFPTKGVVMAPSMATAAVQVVFGRINRNDQLGPVDHFIKKVDNEEMGNSTIVTETNMLAALARSKSFAYRTIA